MTHFNPTELTDEQWSVIQPYLPKPSKVGHPRVDDRKTLNGILYVLKTGCQWNNLPREYGSGVTAWRRFTTWSEAGVWRRIWRELLKTLDEQESLEFSHTVMDSSVVSAKKGVKQSLTGVGRGSRGRNAISWSPVKGFR